MVSTLHKHAAVHSWARRRDAFASDDQLLPGARRLLAQRHAHRITERLDGRVLVAQLSGVREVGPLVPCAAVTAGTTLEEEVAVQVAGKVQFATAGPQRNRLEIVSDQGVIIDELLLHIVRIALREDHTGAGRGVGRGGAEARRLVEDAPIRQQLEHLVVNGQAIAGARPQLQRHADGRGGAWGDGRRPARPRGLDADVVELDREPVRGADDGETCVDVRNLNSAE
mmetsp:Transcript_113068/g.305109  ORF Transcript_113068/g.305109 Transcript_113068/m.305109 type:complete len:226 (+) Transcript_113068:13-690(+)